MSDISEKAIKLINDLRRDISIDIMFTPEKNAEDDSLKALVDYIAELEAEIERFTAHSDIERQDDKCSGHGDISNFPPVMGSGDGLGW